MKFANNLIFLHYPVVASISLKKIDDELKISMNSKKKILTQLKDKYQKKTRNINIVQDIIIDDFEMAIDGNVTLIPNAQANLMRSATKNNLIQLLIKQFDNTTNIKNSEKDFENIYNLLRYACDYKFPNIKFEREYTKIITDDSLNKRIVQVWYIFQQYFKQFDYIDYLNNFVIIKKRSHNIKFIFGILRILLEIGPIICI